MSHNSPPSNPTIQPADPVLRRRCIVALVIVVCVGVAMIAIGFEPKAAMANWLAGHAETLVANPELVAGGVFFAFFPLILCALFLLGFANRVINGMRFPPEGVRVVRDTVVLTGEAARRRGQGLKVLALALFGLSGAVPVMFWAVVSSLGGA